MRGPTVNLQVGFFLVLNFLYIFYDCVSFIFVIFCVSPSLIFLAADEVYCRETKEPEVESWSMSDLPVIVLVVLLLLAILVGLGCALRRFLPCLKNNYISYTFSLLSSPFYCLNNLLFILIVIILSFSFVFNINSFFITKGFSFIYLYISLWYFRGIFSKFSRHSSLLFPCYFVSLLFSYICW